MKKQKQKKDYASEINNALLAYENNVPYKRHNVPWITDRINWCYKFKHITESQKNIFVDRIINIMNNGYYY